jgi:hypothetical protein
LTDLCRGVTELQREARRASQINFNKQPENHVRSNPVQSSPGPASS